MSFHVLRLPFRCATSREPGSAYGHEEVDVVVQEISASDAPVSVRFERVGQTTVLLGWNDRLFKVALDGDGRAFSPSEFESAVSIHSHRQSGRLFDPCEFPTRGVRWGVGEAPPIGGRAKRVARTHRQRNDDLRIAAMARASEFLPEAIVSIDGVIHVAVAEPVLAAPSYGRSVSLSVVADPRRFDAMDVFRLDRIDEARDWLEICRGTGGELLGNIEILRNDAIRRDDELAIATWLVQSCKFEEGPEVPPSDETDLFRVMVQSHELGEADRPIAVGGRPGFRMGVPERRLPTAAAAEDILEDLVTSLDAARSKGKSLTAEQGMNELLALARARWEMAERRGRGSDTRGYRAADDAAALSGLNDSCHP